MKIFILTIVFSCCILIGNAQELFPSSEPASTIPKGVIGIRLMYETYKELPSQRVKYWDGLRILYGITGKLTLMAGVSASNHHFKKFPSDIGVYLANHHSTFFKPTPFALEGINLNLRYRVLSFDGEKRHFRVALTAEGSKSFIPHDGAEPNLFSDNSGVAGGLIITQLYKKFAGSVTVRQIIPFAYRESEQQIYFRSGNCQSYTFSLGYRIYPAKYDSYNNLNVNLYLEVNNVHYEKAEFKVNGSYYDLAFLQLLNPFVYNSLQEGKYSELRPAIQFIFKSNNRLDLGIAQPLYNKSFVIYYPMYFIHFQKYIYKKDKKNIRKNSIIKH